MNITQEVREFARLQEKNTAPPDAEAGMAGPRRLIRTSTRALLK
jgi:hypothetical protein